MHTIPNFDSTHATALRAFLDAPERSPGSMGYCEAAGFLFALACAPELVEPSVWLPAVIDPDNAAATSVENMQSVVAGLMSLYNEMVLQVQDAEVTLPQGCFFRDDPMANLAAGAPISQWANGFKTGYVRLEKVWSEYTPVEIREQFAYQITVLCFFANHGVASAFHEQVKNQDVSLESMAANMQRIFPDAMRGVALLGQSVQEVVAKRSESGRQPPVRSEKPGRNETCTCGSGRKYKKCCGSILH